MGRKRPETAKSRLAKQLIESYDIKTAQDIQEALKDLLGETIESMLKAELDEHLDYEYGQTPLSINTRNGSSKKTVKSSIGELEINIPRDRDASFEPQILKKYDRDISSHIKDIYGFGVSAGLVSSITNKILPTIDEWQNRPLDKVYPFVFIDAIHYHVRENGLIVKKAVYIALGYNINGFKKILGMWIGENETSKYWLMVLNQMKDRGLEDILIISSDNLAGISQAIEAVFPKTEIQKCIIHQIRNSTKFVSYKDLKDLMKDLKMVYQAKMRKQHYKIWKTLKKNGQKSILDV